MLCIVANSIGMSDSRSMWQKAEEYFETWRLVVECVEMF